MDPHCLGVPLSKKRKGRAFHCNLPFRKLAEGKPARMKEFIRSGGDLRCNP